MGRPCLPPSYIGAPSATVPRNARSLPKSCFVHRTSYIGRPCLPPSYMGSVSCHRPSAPRAQIWQSYIVHPTSYIGRLRLPPSYMGGVSRHRRTSNFVHEQLPRSCLGPSSVFTSRAAHPRCPYALTTVGRFPAQRALTSQIVLRTSYIGAPSASVVHRTSYIVHRRAKRRRRTWAGSVCLRPRPWLQGIPSAPASQNSRAKRASSSIVHRTSYLVHRRAKRLRRTSYLVHGQTLSASVVHSNRIFQCGCLAC